MFLLSDNQSHSVPSDILNCLESVINST